MKQKLMSILLLAILAVIPSGCKQNNQDSGDVNPTSAVGVVSEAPTSTQAISPTTTKEDENSPLVSDDFYMKIEDIFSISDKGTVVTGKISEGFVSANAEIELIGFGKETKTVTVGAIEEFRQIRETAKAGDSVGILLNNLKKEELEVGQYLVAKGKLPPVKQYSAKLKFSDEAFLENKVINGSCYFNETDITSIVYLTSNVPDADGYVTAYIKMINAFPMKEGVDFEVRESEKVIALGKVVELEPANFNAIESNINSGSDTIKPEQPLQSGDLDLIPADSRVVLTLTDRGTDKINVIKKVREITSLDLKEAKAIVDYIPSIITDNITKEEALRYQAEFKELGATVTISVYEKE